MPDNPIKEYLKKLEGALVRGDATEHTHRPALKTFLESFSKSIIATNEPKRIKVGAPDFIITRGNVPLGYIEAKDIGKPLDDAERSDQLKRYRESLGNLILTDYLEFRWYVRGEHRLTTRIGKPGAKGKLRIEEDGEKSINEFFSAFLSNETPTISRPKELAERMANLACIIRGIIVVALTGEDKDGSLHTDMEGFRKVLLHDLTEAQFADMYSQTICYGLFAARCNHTTGERFTRQNATFDLPKTNPFLRQMFGRIAGPELDERITWAVDDLAELLNRVHIEAILKDFTRLTSREDPVVHFYETFLAAYDPDLREKRGIYYTPESVVSYIVQSVDHILKNNFHLAAGLADSEIIHVKTPDNNEFDIHKVLILDPATGTGTFLYKIVGLIFERFKGNEGMWSGYVSKHLLPRLFGFEIMMAPYAVAHLKLGLLLSDTAYDFKSGERLRIYLTNTLEEAREIRDLPLFAKWLAEEANAAGMVKHQAPVMVILGNPPYSGQSANKGEWIENLIKGRDTFNGQDTSNYFQVDGKPLGERTSKWLLDDYVKFIRFAQWRIEQTGYGVLAFISNHGYLDNPTFRGMRQSLMNTFDDIFILDLHGNSKKSEKCPDGSDDKNVFDIQQGVAVGIFIKHIAKKVNQANVFHADLWGLRDNKYTWLRENHINTTKWESLSPQTPFYLFNPQNKEFIVEYNSYIKITNAMPVFNTGLITSRDKFVFGFEKIEVGERVREFAASSLEHARDHYGLRDVRERTLSESISLLRDMTNIDAHMTPCLYRPFDIRWLFYHHALVRWPVYDVMGHMLAGDNIALITSRMTKGETFKHAQVTKNIAEVICMSSKTSNNGFVFPLYLYSNLFEENTGQRRLSSSSPWPPGKNGRIPNFQKEFIVSFEKQLKMKFISDGSGNLKSNFGPEDVLSYIYAIFYSNIYRLRYFDFLRIDFPHIPITSNKDIFTKLSNIGSDLVKSHLFEKTFSNTVKYPISGDNQVTKINYTGEEEANKWRVYINERQYFEGIPQDIWEFQIGGYQVCDKWLKGRKGRQLSYNDISHFMKIVSVLSGTIQLMEKIDDTIDERGGWPLR